MDNIVIIADDLTGAADTAVQFSPFFEETRLVSYRKWGPNVKPARPTAMRAMAIYTNSRALTADAAHRRLLAVAQGLEDLQGIDIYKKIDSCMRGNVGAECDALLDQLDCTASFITPAFPEMGRTTVGDVHRVHGVPLGLTEIAHDPVTPVTESGLVKIMARQSRHAVGYIGLAYLEGDDARLHKEIERQLQSGVRHIVFDAGNRAHLDRIARLFLSLDHNLLPVGSAGLAGSIAKLLDSKPVFTEPAEAIAADGFNLLVCGTTSDVTRQQIDELQETAACEVIQLSPVTLADRSRTADFSKAVCAVQSYLLRTDVSLTINPQPKTSLAGQPTGNEPDAGEIAEGLGRFAAQVMAKVKPGHLFLTGGDTADAVLTALGAEGIRILGEMVAGVVQGVIVGGRLDGLAVVTKAGAFGQRDTLVAVHEFWQRTEDRGQRTEVRGQRTRLRSSSDATARRRRR